MSAPLACPLASGWLTRKALWHQLRQRNLPLNTYIKRSAE